MLLFDHSFPVNMVNSIYCFFSVGNSLYQKTFILSHLIRKKLIWVINEETLRMQIPYASHTQIKRNYIQYTYNHVSMLEATSLRLYSFPPSIPMKASKTFHESPIVEYYASHFHEVRFKELIDHINREKIVLDGLYQFYCCWLLIVSYILNILNYIMRVIPLDAIEWVALKNMNKNIRQFLHPKTVLQK